MTTSTATCTVCGSEGGEHPCQTPSGRHWYSLDADTSPMPPMLAAALTAPELRTPEQVRLMEQAVAEDRARQQRDSARSTPTAETPTTEVPNG